MNKCYTLVSLWFWMYPMSLTIPVNRATFTFLPTVSLNTHFYQHCVCSRQGFQHSASRIWTWHTNELVLHPSPPLLPFPPPSLPLSIPASSVFPFSLMLSQAAVLFWVTVSDAQVTKAQRCPVSTIPSVSSVLRQMLAETEIPTRCLEQTALRAL